MNQTFRKIDLINKICPKKLSDITFRSWFHVVNLSYPKSKEKNIKLFVLFTVYKIRFIKTCRFK